MAEIDYQDTLNRIQGVYNSCSELEKKELRRIIEEVSLHGYSQTLETLWLSDFKEVPVSIDEFICNDYYLGLTNRSGQAVYPYWKQTAHNIFSAGNRYSEIVLSGATRIGKTSTMTIIMAYMLYRLMLYRNPHEYFKKKEVSRFTIAFANLTMKLAEGVCYREFNDTLKECPFFNDHGRFSRSERNFYYIPEGDKIDIIAGSDASMFLGMQVWCLVGDTKILTADGIKTLEECAGTHQDVLQYMEDGTVQYTNAEVVRTKYVTETIRIELEDGSIIEGTPEHKVMLADGSYKELGKLTSSDELFTLNSNAEVDEMNLKDKDATFLVYEHVSPDGKRYIGITSKRPEERWQPGGKGYIDNTHFWNAIVKHGWNNFEHNIIATDLSLEDACKLECELIAEHDTMNPDCGYNHTTGGNWSTPDEATRAKLSMRTSERAKDPEYRAKLSQSLMGHDVSDITRQKISAVNKGRKRSQEFCAKQRARTHTPETLEKLRGHTPWNKGRTKETDERIRKVSEAQVGRVMSDEQKCKVSEVRKAQYQNGYSPVWINNGEVERQIQQGNILPNGFCYGRLNIQNVYIYRGSESKKISHNEVDTYLSDGWLLGRPPEVISNIRKANQRMYWEYEGHRFESAYDLAAYLREHGYPKIVDSTITSLSRRGFESSPTYKSLEGKIRRIENEDKIN